MSDSVSWLRLYHSFLDNDKTGCLSLTDRGAWVTLAILASANSPRGKIPPVAILKRYMGKSYAVNPSRIKLLLDRFIRLALIDSRPDGLYVHNFNTRQWIPGGDNIGKQSNDNLSSGDSRVEKGENQHLVNTWSTNCCNDMLIPGGENKQDTGKRYTEKAATDTDAELLGGLQNAFMLFNAHIAAIRLRLSASRTTLADSRIGKQSSDNVIAFPASNRQQATSTCAHVEHKPTLAPQAQSSLSADTRTGSQAITPPDGGQDAVIGHSTSASHNHQDGIGLGFDGEGAIGRHTSKARTVSQNSLPGAARSAFDAAFSGVWALWQSLPGIAHHKRFVDSDRQAFKQTWAMLGGDAQALDDIHEAIKRYSAWSVGAKAGRYRPAYRWTFVEFIRHKRGSLIQRLASDSWEATCEPFTKASGLRDRSVASLLASASRITEITGEGR